MSDALFRVVPFDANHDRSSFRSGSEPLDRYFRSQVTQDVRRRVAACFVALSQEGSVAGFYTLSMSSVPLSNLPDATARNLPRYPVVPVARMGRLAVGLDFRGRGLGGALLADALGRVANSEIAAYALLVDAKDELAAAFYRHHGFIALPSTPLALFLPLSSAALALPKSR